MTFSTRGNPRLAQGTAITSLGAVGGPRGVAAGGLRILVEFVTSYDPAAIKRVQADLAALDAQEAAASTRAIARDRKIATTQDRITRAQATVKAQLDTRERAAFHKYQNAVIAGNRKNQTQARAELESTLQGAVVSGRISAKQKSEILAVARLKRDVVRISQEDRAIHADIADIEEERIQKQKELGQLQGAVPRLGARVAGLAIGAVGGILGGAILGVGFQLAQVALEAVGDAIQDFIDPARHAREASLELGNAIGKIASGQNLSMLDATKQYLKEIGLAADEATAKVIANAAAQGRIAGTLEEQAKLYQVTLHPQAQYKENLKTETAALIELDKAAGTLITTEGVGKAVGMQVVNVRYYQAEAAKNLAEIERELAIADMAEANAKRAQATATAIATGAMVAYASAIAAANAQRIAPLEAQREGLELEPSKRTEALQAQIEALQGGGGGGDQLRQLREERALLLLRQRLALMGQNIVLEKYAGKFLLEAINAKIAALQKEGDAQQRVNKLLDLQYKESQKIKRQEGEAIPDFLARRAQENRDLLQERADLEREVQISVLNDLKVKTQTEVELRENAEAQKTAAAQAGTSARIKALQKELKASQKADADALKNKQKALDAQIEAFKVTSSEITELASDASIQQTKEAIRSARSQEAAIANSGRLQGLIRAKNVIEALRDGFGLPKEYATGLLKRIDPQIQSLDAWMSNYLGNRPGGGVRRFQQGGVFPLTNASGAFGGNMRFGEAGPELGVVLSNRVTQALKDSRGGAQFGNIYINKSQDEFRDRYMIKKLVREAVSEALG